MATAASTSCVQAFRRQHTRLPLSLSRSYASSATAPRPSINAGRLNATLHQTCAWGEAHRYGDGENETGMRRLTLDANDVTARRWLCDEMAAVGCNAPVIDSMGNMFFTRPGRRGNDGPPIAMGSHLDTQPNGGRYDGILGIMAAVEAMRTLDQHGIQTHRPIALVNWTNEEGARYAQSICGSGVWADLLKQDEAYALPDMLPTGDAKPTFGEALEASGFRGSTPASFKATPLAAHFELHIEQGPILEQSGGLVGVVHGAQAYVWYEVTVRGRESHTGTTPLAARSDAMLAAARMIDASNRLATQHKGLAATGQISLQPGSINTCAGEVKFSLDVRHATDDGLAQLVAAIQEESQRIAPATGDAITTTWRKLFASKAVRFDSTCIEAIHDAASKHVATKDILPLTSGAGHDSCATSKHCPTAMIFVPSRDGLSHHPREYTTPEHCALGAQVLLDAVLLYDEKTAAATA